MNAAHHGPAIWRSKSSTRDPVNTLPLTFPNSLIEPPETDKVIQQRYGTITYLEGDVKKSGTALTEYGFGKFADTKLL